MTYLTGCQSQTQHWGAVGMVVWWLATGYIQVVTISPCDLINQLRVVSIPSIQAADSIIQSWYQSDSSLWVLFTQFSIASH